jgi:hypothetical protein
MSRSPKSRSLAAELMALRDKSGKIHVPRAHEWARTNPDSLLHGELEWNNRVAAQAHRMWQIRQLIAVHVVNDEGDRLLVSLSIDRTDGGYRPLDDVMAAPPLREIMLGDALAELQRVKAKYNRLTELTRVWEAANAAAAEAAKGPRKRPARLPIESPQPPQGPTARQ